MKLHSGENIGGVARFEFCHIEDIISVNPFRFKNGKWWEIIEHLPQSGQLKDDEQETDQGITYTYAGTFKRHFPSKKDELLFSRYIGECSIIRITDLNGMKRVIGTLDTPVLISRAGDRGAKPSDMAGNEYKYSVTQIERAF